MSHVGSGGMRQTVSRTVLVTVNISREDRLVETLQSLVTLHLLLLGSFPQLEDCYEQDHEEDYET